MPGSRSRAPMRATRAAMFAAVCVVLAAVGHSSMSGTDLPLGWLLGAFAVTAGLARTATGRRCGPVGITSALLLAQGALHLVFSWAEARNRAGSPSPSRADAPAGAAAAMSGHHHTAGPSMPGVGDAAAMADGAGMADMPDMAGMADAAGHGAGAGVGAVAGVGPGGVADLLAMAGHGGLAMIAVHLLAALLCGLWLARGEAAVFRWARAAGAAALVAARPLSRALALLRTRSAPVPAPPAHRPAYVRPRRLRGAVHAHTAVRRGPPVRRAVAATAPGLPARA
ncbi:hypothetical protein ACIRP0_16430 [Streptomyces sp. NPDC101733]|uniref:hypothetical protein n=1 Tax=unclassified Streptomyces TaxID=2593676 RepID=UPI00382458DC